MAGKNWGWLPEHMPGVAKLLATRRAELGAEWVATCWRRGVVAAEPGWFFAAEGALTVGVPVDDQMLGLWHQQRARHPDARLLDLRQPEQATQAVPA